MRHSLAVLMLALLVSLPVSPPILMGSARAGQTVIAAEAERDCNTCPAFVRIPPGTFLLGSPSDEPGRGRNEGPQVQVTLPRAFAMTVAEISRAEFAAFVDDTGYRIDRPCFVYDGLSWKPQNGFDWRNPGFRQGPDHPAVCINEADAKAYARWLNRQTGARYRLPSEAEWEYAAKAGETGAIPLDRLCGIANGAARESSFEYRNTACRDPHPTTAPAGAYPTNAFGLTGLLGNALEWTGDCYAPGHEGADPTGVARQDGDCRYRVMRGGNWAAAPQHLRPSNRGVNAPGDRWATNGFRLVREID